MDLSLIIPTLFAGLLTFLAPCTLPLVPGYLGFISGVSAEELQKGGTSARRKIFVNGLLYVTGFSIVFIILGSLFGLGGAALIQYRAILTRIGGVFIIIFGLYMIKVIKIPLLEQEHQFGFTQKLKPGSPISSLIFGATFAFGWSPCVGPILGTVLTLASSTATVGQGAFLLFVFSLGLAIPFLLMALAIGSAPTYIKSINKHLDTISLIGGIFLIMIGLLIITNNFNQWVAFFYQNLNIINYEGLLDFL